MRLAKALGDSISPRVHFRKVAPKVYIMMIWTGKTEGKSCLFWEALRLRLTYTDRKYALIILNQPFSFALLRRLWCASRWRCCADGGANRLHDVLLACKGADDHEDVRTSYLPDLIKGDLDSLRDDVRAYYESKNIHIIQDDDQDSTDLMKCVQALAEKERIEGGDQYDIIILGGLSGRLDQTVHTLSYVHKLRDTRQRVFTVTDDNVAWLLDRGEHQIHIDHNAFGLTCGLLPVGIDSTILTTNGLRWNLSNTESSFDGMVSTSNHLVPSEPVVTVQTSKPIWWSMELRPKNLELESYSS